MKNLYVVKVSDGFETYFLGFDNLTDAKNQTIEMIKNDIIVKWEIKCLPVHKNKTAEEIYMELVKKNAIDYLFED